MHMVIDIGSYAHGPWTTPGGLRIDENDCDVKEPHGGHVRIHVRNAAQPHWQRRPPWASLEFAMKPPQGATETLRWAVRLLDDHLRRSAGPSFSDDDWDVVEPMAAEEAHGTRTGVRGSSLDKATG